VAVKHFDWLEHSLLAAGYAADVENLALCWNAGLSAVMHDRIQPAHRGYAERVGNLYADFKKGAQP
jgi:hypothetical protein